jgi:hypothetical protein
LSIKEGGKYPRNINLLDSPDPEEEVKEPEPEEDPEDAVVRILKEDKVEASSEPNEFDEPLPVHQQEHTQPSRWSRQPLVIQDPFIVDKVNKPFSY